MKEFITKKAKDLKEYILARRYMRQCIIIERGGKRVVLSRKYAIKDLLSYDCYNCKELKKLSLSDLISLYVAVSTGGMEVYNKETGKDEYVGYIS